MKYYIATSYENKDDFYPYLCEIMDSLGLVNSLDWSKGPPPAEEFNAICGSDILIIALPGGSGTFFEFGVGYTHLKLFENPKIIVYSVSENIDKCYHFALPEVHHVVGDILGLIACVKSIIKQ